MRTFSAADSVLPAIQRTRELLFRPFAWGTYLKLGLVAIVTEGTANNFHSSTQGGHSQAQGSMAWPPFHLQPQWIAAIAAAVLVIMVLAMVVFYLVTRLRFAFFHCLIHNTREIRPGWWLYREPAIRFFWLNVAVGFCYLLLAALVAIPFVTGFWRLFHEIPPGGHPQIASLLILALPLIPLILLLALVGIMLDVVLRDWMLPHYALEHATAAEAWMKVWDRITAEKREFFVYALLRLILPTIAMIALFIVLIVPGAMLAGSLAAAEYGIHSAFAGAAGAAHLAGILLEAFLAVLAFGFALVISICLGGPLSTGVREYALIFYGGRYQPLGNALYPPPSPAVQPAPQS